ncbi:hypothetical protein [Pseudoduganella ginsengisoli]|uniref:Uncharacterized protein n=1 Tax=Pseudoduganella ginsengisoli TaxID=1462440 RepID=A0A6L6PZU5_9BURK|nr:hypothetical protein [Pseudoduganella ginsengisoli]MTW02689.1 hypothetical protein [Pseudoduganella ginsengisoli]
MKSDPEQLDGRSYTITPVSTASGNGWWLRTFVDGDEVGYRVFLARTANRAESMAWWDGLTNDERTDCATYSISATEAYQRHLLDVAYAEAETTACAWMDATAFPALV